MSVPTVAIPPRAQVLRTLHSAIFAELTPTIDLALRVGVLTAAGCRKAEIVERTGADPAELRAAQALLRKATVRIAAQEAA